MKHDVLILKRLNRSVAFFLKETSRDKLEVSLVFPFND